MTRPGPAREVAERQTRDREKHAGTAKEHRQARRVQAISMPSAVSKMAAANQHQNAALTARALQGG